MDRSTEEAAPVAGVLTVAAGTSDLPVAEEAALTAELMGNSVERLWDVGIAGVHRLLENLPLLREARVIVAVAGMEGALPSLVGGAGLLARYSRAHQRRLWGELPRAFSTSDYAELVQPGNRRRQHR